MHRCPARIDLERSPTSPEHSAWHPDETPEDNEIAATYTPAQQITGTVEVAPDAPMRAARVTLGCHWTATGRAPEFRGNSDEILLFDGNWVTPGARQFPFIFRTPCGPYTYHGRLVQVRWMLEVRVETEGREVSREAREFVLQPARQRCDYIPGILPDAASRGARNELIRRGLARALGLLVVFAIALLTLPAARDAWTWMLAAAAAITLLSLWIRPPAQRHAHAPFNPDYQAEPGDLVAFLVELKPSFRTEPRRVSARLIGVEQTNPSARPRRAGRARRAHKPEAADAPPRQLDRHHFFDAPAEIGPVATHNNAPTARNTYRVRCRIPADAPFSFYCPTACVSWAVEVHVDVGSWPDWRRAFPLIVRPSTNSVPPTAPERAQPL